MLFYGEYILHLHCQWERLVFHTKIHCFKQVYVCGIAYFPFHSVSTPFRFPFCVLVTPQNLGLCSGITAFKQGGIFIMPNLLGHGTSVYTVSAEGPSRLHALYDKSGVLRYYSNPGQDRTTYKGKQNLVVKMFRGLKNKLFTDLFSISSAVSTATTATKAAATQWQKNHKQQTNYEADSKPHGVIHQLNQS